MAPRAPEHGPDDFWYLATPYSLYPKGHKQAYIDASIAAGALLRDGYRIFCPIAHSHPIAKYGGVAPADHDIWLPADGPLMRAAKGGIVVKMEGWRESVGVKHEMEYFLGASKPLLFMDWPICQKVYLSASCSTS